MDLPEPDDDALHCAAAVVVYQLGGRMSLRVSRSYLKIFA